MVNFFIDAYIFRKYNCVVIIIIIIIIIILNDTQSLVVFTYSMKGKTLVFLGVVS